jgi:glycosyltransferase involved in cell wall biosynthesis
MGNDAYHLYIYEQLLRVPGLVIIHDLSISSVLYNYHVGLRDKWLLFRQEFRYSEGEEALQVLEDYLKDGRNDPLLAFFAQQPMLRRLVESNFAFVTHLQYCTQILEEKYRARNAYTMYLGSPDPLKTQRDKAEARRALDLPEDAFIICVAGYLQGNKQIDVCLRAVARLRVQYPHILPVLVGPINSHDGYDEQLWTLIERLGIRPTVRLTGYVPKSELAQYLVACDVQVNLRYPTFGQMSSTLSRGIAAGRPVIITDIPEWQFFPDDFCWRVPHEDTEGLQLEQYIRTLIENPTLVEAMGRRARDFYTREGSTAQAARRLIHIVDDVIENVPKERAPRLPYGLVPGYIHSEYVQQTHAEWVAVRTAGTRNWLANNLPRIPCIGSPVYKCYRLVVNLCKIRLLRQAEHCYYHAVAHSLKSVQEAMNAFYQAFHQETFLLHEEISQLYDKLYDMEGEQSIDVAPLPDTCVLENPLADRIRGVRQRSRQVTDISSQRNSDEELYPASGQRLQAPQEIGQRKQEARFSFIEKIPILQNGAKPLLVMGCNPGEFLGLLRTHGIHAVGIDTKLLHIDHLSRVGYDAHQCEATDYLQRIEDNSLAGITAFHLIEHFPHDYLVEILSLGYKKLAPGGLILLETLNPYCFESLDKCAMEPPSLRLVQPFQLAFLVDQYQFREPKLIFSNPIRTRSTARRKRWLHFYQNYAVLAFKSGMEKEMSRERASLHFS